MLRRRANHPHRDGDEYGEHEKSYLIDEEASHGLVVGFAYTMFEVVPVEPLSFAHLYEFGEELTHPFGPI